MAPEKSMTVAGFNGWVTIREASRVLGITVSGVHMAIKRRRIPTVKLGAARLVRLSDLRLTR